MYANEKYYKLIQVHLNLRGRLPTKGHGFGPGGRRTFFLQKMNHPTMSSRARAGIEHERSVSYVDMVPAEQTITEDVMHEK